MTNKQFKDKVYNIYLEKGQEEALQWAEKQTRTHWEYCEACEAETAVLLGEHECLICGQTTKPITNDRD